MIAVLSLALSLSSLFGLASAHGKCVDLTIPITATAENVVWAFPPLKDPHQVAYFFNLATQRDGNTSALVAGKTNITRTFSISAQYCTPTKKSPRSSTVQILTHGLGFDKSYWNLTLTPTSASYTSAALAAGYSTFSYDRIGNGLSTIADPYTVAQSFMQLSILIELTKYVRSGKIHDCNPQKVVHVGHSFGSSLTNGLAAAAPHLTDGIICTSFSHNGSFANLFLAAVGHSAPQNQPQRFSNLPNGNGFVTWADQFSNQYIFLQYPFFDPLLLSAAEATKQPFTIGEALTVGSLDFRAPQFTGPVLFLAAQHDLIFCGFDCTGIIDGPDAVTPRLFPRAKSFEAYVQPDVGHGQNLHLNASGAYGVALGWLERNGL